VNCPNTVRSFHLFRMAPGNTLSVAISPTIAAAKAAHWAGKLPDLLRKRRPRQAGPVDLGDPTRAVDGQAVSRGIAPPLMLRFFGIATLEARLNLGPALAMSRIRLDEHIEGNG